MNKASNESGQLLLMAILITLVLFVSIPIIILVNQMGGHQRVSSLQANKAETTAVSGITYAVQQLTPIWTAALAGNFTGTDCNQGPVKSPSGMPFALSCDQSGRPYEVHVISTARSSNNVAVSSRSVEAYLSQRTVGVKLTNNFTASAAMLLVNTPTGVTNGTPLTVHWGPAVCLSSATLPAWVLYDPMNSQSLSAGLLPGFPRKFSLGGITGNGSVSGDPFYRVPNWMTTAVTSDHKEFWAFATQTVAPQLDDAGYQSAALATNPGLNIPAHLRSGPARAPVSGGYFSVPAGDAIVFDSSFHPLAGSIIYVNGDAELDDTAIDLSTGALIVTGNLLLNSLNAGDGATGMVLNVPPSAALEYPYYSSGDAWPCNTKAGLTCTVGSAEAAPLFGSAGRVHFRGFLWVQGILTVNNNWNMVGVIVAGNPSLQTGGLTMNGSLTLAYDDIVNHNILTPTTELQSDILRDIASH